MRFMVFVMLAVILGANFYVFFRLWHLIPGETFLRPLLVVFAMTAVGSIFAAFLLAGKLPTPIIGLFYSLGTSWFFILLYLLAIFLVLDLIRLIGLLPLNRFMFESWTGLGVLTALLTVIFTTGYLVYQKKERVELNLDVPENTQLKRPLKIVALSDIHLGYTIGKKEFARWVELINAENPDLVLIAGDITDNNVRPLLEQDVASVFRQIRSRYGVFAALGNHEYIGGLEGALVFLREAGVEVLRDESVLLDDNIYLVGRDDRTNPRRKPLGKLVAGLDRSIPILLLDHQPYHLEEAEQYGIALQISGHTHFGQVWPISWITEGIYEVAHGYKPKGDTHVYVSSGLGIWGGKFRIGTRSEYVVIHLE
ncbi:MAG: metallophosphoesterase [Rikenellaceae bacterium]|nr:metallophosphoesterase [Rikenellaceae bacterium]